MTTNDTPSALGQHTGPYAPPHLAPLDAPKMPNPPLRVADLTPDTPAAAAGEALMREILAEADISECYCGNPDERAPACLWCRAQDAIAAWNRRAQPAAGAACVKCNGTGEPIDNEHGGCVYCQGTGRSPDCQPAAAAGEAQASRYTILPNARGEQPNDVLARISAQCAGLIRDRDAAIRDRDEWKGWYRKYADAVDRVFQRCPENPRPILPDFLRLGDDKIEGVVRLAEAYKSAIRDRAAWEQHAADAMARARRAEDRADKAERERDELRAEVVAAFRKHGLAPGPEAVDALVRERDAARWDAEDAHRCWNNERQRAHRAEVERDEAREAAAPVVGEAERIAIDALGSIAAESQNLHGRPEDIDVAGIMVQEANEALNKISRLRSPQPATTEMPAQVCRVPLRCPPHGYPPPPATTADGGEVAVTDAMADAALAEWWAGSGDNDETNRDDMKAAIAAALRARVGGGGA